MDPIAPILDAHFPTELNRTKPLTMTELGDMRTALKKLLPDDASVEMTFLMNSILLSVYYAGNWTRRTCTVHVNEPRLAGAAS